MRFAGREQGCEVLADEQVDKVYSTPADGVGQEEGGGWGCGGKNLNASNEFAGDGLFVHISLS